MSKASRPKGDILTNLLPLRFQLLCVLGVGVFSQDRSWECVLFISVCFFELYPKLNVFGALRRHATAREADDKSTCGAVF